MHHQPSLLSRELTRGVTAAALADFRDRVRRPAYLATLAAAVLLGYVAVPDSGAHWVILQLGDYRGRYNSAYVGTATALAGGLWISLGGFYLTRNSLERDRSSGVGRLLAATPLRTPAYLAGKFLGNLLLLTSMLVALAATALVMQLARGESATVDPLALCRPYALLALPMVALTAALALLFESLPLLRTGLGNVVWFGSWLALATGGQGPGLPLGGTGVNAVVESLRDAAVAQHLPVSGEFSLGLTLLDAPLTPFPWPGFTPTPAYTLGRLAVLLLALALAVLPALWFPRFDPARRRADPSGPAPQAPSPEPRTPELRTILTPHQQQLCAPPRRRPGPSPHPPAAAGFPPLGRLYAGELGILLQGTPWWWYAGAALLALAGFAAPLPGTLRVLLPLAWIWPILLWSRLGTQGHEHRADTLLAACPAPGLRLLAEWAAGATLAALAGAAPLVRMLAAADLPGAAAWTAGALFIPSLALALGTLSRTHRLFQALYLPLWYTVATGLPLFDYMGALHTAAHFPGPHPALTLAVAAALLGVAAVARRRPSA
ncbi:ABC transporter permease [Streptomyces albospinus]|uniref:ABC transporter permease n=1 Tax=Streptomyces albospinus TaxID=285515 RepID=A0ABQ2UL99_9ACTN|nr:ABC transporter permease [Streptomyces albospinus]GGU43376.1 ABC transporter permease [Streptomyces albospinus]